MFCMQIQFLTFPVKPGKDSCLKPCRVTSTQWVQPGTVFIRGPTWPDWPTVPVAVVISILISDSIWGDLTTGHCSRAPINLVPAQNVNDSELDELVVWFRKQQLHMFIPLIETSVWTSCLSIPINLYYAICRARNTFTATQLCLCIDFCFIDSVNLDEANAHTLFSIRSIVEYAVTDTWSLKTATIR